MSSELRVITEDELFIEQSMQDEFNIATKYIVNLLEVFKRTHNKTAKKIYISDDEELQSIMMWVIDSLGLTFERTGKKTYLE